MDKWRQICARQSARLKSALELCKHAQALSRYGSVSDWIDSRDTTALESAKNNINKKLPRLEKGEFHIAVVGMEKAGKSSFINAWLESDLLPNKQKRCTFTTTKLHSVNATEKQCLKVLPKNQQEFAELCTALEDQAKKDNGDISRNAKEDLKVIAENRGCMDELMARGEMILPFATLDDIQEDLYRYAADPHYAHAIKQLDLYTTSLASMDGILFYDVPGLNSGLSKHKEETERMLADSDAVVVVKSVIAPDIEDSEKKILEYARIGDESVPLRDKMFFFISRVDMLPTRENFLSNKKDFLDPLESFNIDKNKVVFGAATTVLFLKNRLKDRMVMAEPAALKQHMQELLDLPDAEDETIINAAGIREMRDKIEHYLNHEREQILNTATNSLVNQIETAARNIYDEVRKHVPENPTDAKRARDREINREFEKWMDDFLTTIKARLDTDGASTLVGDTVKEMSAAYGKQAENRIAALKYLEPARRDEFFSSQIMEYGEDYANLNTSLRKEIYDREILPLIRELAVSLSTDLHERLVRYMDSLSHHFNDSIDVRTTIMDYMNVQSEEDYRKHLESAMGALYLRFARPLSEALLRFRHGVKDRTELARHLSKTLQSLSLSYPDDLPPAYANLAQYVARGATSGPAAVAVKKGGQTLGKTVAEKVARKAAGAVVGGTMGGPIGAALGGAVGDMVMDKVENMMTKPEVCTSREDVVRELEADREALKLYLANAVFECSGIGEFAENEMGHIRRAFIASKSSLRADAKTAYDWGDPRFMELVPTHLRQKECDTRVSDLLHQLGMALQHRGDVSA